jgi:hypothetical protein
MRSWVCFTLFVALLVTPDAAGAGPAALPLHFHIFVYEGQQQGRKVDWKPNITIPTSLAGWTCRTGARLETQNDEAINGVWQVGAFTCASASGQVDSTVGCLLTSEPEGLRENKITVRDAAGHAVTLRLACSNIDGL